jgi:hypothetical protein
MTASPRSPSPCTPTKRPVTAGRCCPRHGHRLAAAAGRPTALFPRVGMPRRNPPSPPHSRNHSPSLSLFSPALRADALPDAVKQPTAGRRRLRASDVCLLVVQRPYTSSTPSASPSARSSPSIATVCRPPAPPPSPRAPRCFTDPL